MRKQVTPIVFISFWMLSLVIYYRTMEAGFVGDFVGWQESYDKGSFKDILNCFGYKGLHQLLHLVFYSFYRLFRTNGLPWYLLFTFLHALNGTLMFRVAHFLVKQLSIKKPAQIAAASALAFLVNPFNVEPLVWKVCVHYLLSLTFLLIILWNVGQYLTNNQNTKSLIYVHLALTLSLFTLELSLVFPIFTLIWALFGYYTYASSISIKKILSRLIAPQFFIVFGYLFLNKWILGDWVGHYGTQVHLQIKAKDFIGTMYKYFAKYSLFGRFLDYKLEEKMYGFFDNSTHIWTITAILLLITVGLLIKWTKLSNRIKITWLFFVSFFVALAPIANLFFYFLLQSENDRYGYLATPFFMLTLVMLIFWFTPKIRYSLLVIWLAISIFYQQKGAKIWEENAIIYQSVLHDFRWYDSPKILLLNISDNYSGTYLFRIIKREDPLVDDLRYSLQKPYNGQLQQVAQFNIMHLDEGVTVEQVDSMQLKVIFNQWGNWWWRNGIGATNYENDLYKFKIINKGYQLTFKSRPDDWTLIYQVGPHLKEFKFE